MTDFGQGVEKLLVSFGLGVAGDFLNVKRRDIRDSYSQQSQPQDVNNAQAARQIYAAGSSVLSPEGRRQLEINYAEFQVATAGGGEISDSQLEQFRLKTQGLIQTHQIPPTPSIPGSTPTGNPLTGYNGGNTFANNNLGLAGNSGEPEFIDPFGGQGPFSPGWLETLKAIPSPVPPAITQTPTTPPAATAPAITPATLETADGKLKELQASDKWATINSTTVEFSYKKENGETAVVKTNLGEFLTQKLNGSQGWGGAGTKATTPEQYGAFVKAVEALKSGLSAEELGSFVAALQQRGVTEAATWWLVEEKRKNQQQQQPTA